MIDRDEGIDDPEYQELCDYIYKHSKGRGKIDVDTDAGYGPPYDSLTTPSYITDGSGAKYAFQMDSDSFPGFIVSLELR